MSFFSRPGLFFSSHEKIFFMSSNLINSTRFPVTKIWVSISGENLPGIPRNRIVTFPVAWGKELIFLAGNENKDYSLRLPYNRHNLIMAVSGFRLNKMKKTWMF